MNAHGFRLSCYRTDEQDTGVRGYHWFAVLPGLPPVEGFTAGDNRKAALYDASAALAKAMDEQSAEETTEAQLCRSCALPVKTGERCPCAVIQ